MSQVQPPRGHGAVCISPWLNGPHISVSDFGMLGSLTGKSGGLCRGIALRPPGASRRYANTERKSIWAKRMMHTVLYCISNLLDKSARLCLKRRECSGDFGHCAPKSHIWDVYHIESTPYRPADGPGQAKVGQIFWRKVCDKTNDW
jgi:hypothetical protein